MPTISMTSAWDITAAVVPPRSVYVHHPLGHTTGMLGDRTGQRELLRAALRVGLGATRGEIIPLPLRWTAEPGWEERAYSPGHTPVNADGKPSRD